LDVLLLLLNMALRTFRSNPSLGGFGGESSAPRANLLGGVDGAWQDCDAFAQIIKELVDNAVDSCCMETRSHDDDDDDTTKKATNNRRNQNSNSNKSKRNKKRVRVVLERFEPPSTGPARENANANISASANDAGSQSRSSPIVTGNDHDSGEEAFDADEIKDRDEILRVTVSDNGCGMENIQDCVEAFRSSKAGATIAKSRQKNATTKNDQHHHQQQPMTAGRYGIGLTLCLLHAQRLVPNSCASITSATTKANHFTKTQYVVDTEGDSVRCVERTWIEKSHSKESGTSISILVPVSLALRVWSLFRVLVLKLLA
jgi:HSP90 family molecular chaperone